ncbi:SAF domain-containing protein [Geodermatophilus nigrescens]|uniref:Chaperone for flagella basal body P-ring formation n=1 Tax=Geodermatophilus nigrescens TaxID=1070870 RepID=A0A1M5NEW2_9ACTN|nr:SAF domain-containing protein [Geodermatophilus nigrescens]SHG87987.1 Chaperone for flagella basal body P-ring formation [Geodermatophilus nigrescens]
MSAATRTVPPTATPATGTAAGPVPRRVRPPRWLDLRLVLGVLLVLGSVLLGARVVGAADATVPVWSVAADLAAGTEIQAADLVAVQVRLGDAAGAYLSTGTDPAGRTLARAVRAGELLPRAALEEPADLVQVALPVQAGYVPPGLTRGQVVDVYGVTDPAGTTTGEGVVPVVEGATVQAVSGRAEGVLSTATTTVQVVVGVPAADAAAVLGSIGGRPLVVVVHGSVDGSVDGAPSAARPSASPSPGAPTTGASSTSTPTTGAPAAGGPLPAPAAPSTAAAPPAVQPAPAPVAGPGAPAGPTL